MSLAINLTTGKKRSVDYAGVPASDEDQNAVTLASVTCTPDDPNMISTEPAADGNPLGYVVKDNPTSGTGETPITETFTDSNGNTFEQRGIVTVSAGPIAVVGDPTVSDEVDRDA